MTFRPTLTLAALALAGGLSACSATPSDTPAHSGTTTPDAQQTMAPVDYYSNLTAAPPGLPTYELTVTAGGPVDVQFRSLENFTTPDGTTGRDYRTTLGEGGTWTRTVQGAAWGDGWVLQVDRVDAAAAAAAGAVWPLSCEVTVRVPDGPVLRIVDETSEPSGTATCSALAAPRPARTATSAAAPAAVVYPCDVPAEHARTVCAPQGLSVEQCRWTWDVTKGEVSAGG